MAFDFTGVHPPHLRDLRKRQRVFFWGEIEWISKPIGSMVLAYNGIYANIKGVYIDGIHVTIYIYIYIAAPWILWEMIVCGVTHGLIKGSLGGETSVLRTFRMSGKKLVKETVSQRNS